MELVAGWREESGGEVLGFCCSGGRMFIERVNTEGAGLIAIVFGMVTCIGVVVVFFFFFLCVCVCAHVHVRACEYMCFY